MVSGGLTAFGPRPPPLACAPGMGHAVALFAFAKSATPNRQRCRKAAMTGGRARLTEIRLPPLPRFKTSARVALTI